MGVRGMSMGDKKFENNDYVEVAERIREFRQLYPNGSLRPVDPANPYRIETIGDKTFIVYAAVAYRGPDDVQPGIGLAWEPFPGKTNFTRDSELQNAETSAWGRAIVAALAADTKKGIASADEMRARTTVKAANLPPADFARAELLRLVNQRRMDPKKARADFAARTNGEDLQTSTNETAIHALLNHYQESA
jgi:hypothetical protein